MNVTEQNEIVTQFSSRLNEPHWLLQKRLEALNELERYPLPKLERTNIKNWKFDVFRFYDEESSTTETNQLPTVIQSFISNHEPEQFILQQNRRVLIKPNQPNSQGVIYTDLNTAAIEHEDLVRPYLHESIKNEKNKLFAWNKVFWNGGVFLYVPKNQEVKLPFQSLFWAKGEKSGIFPHILVVAEENSRLELITNFVADHQDNPALNNAIIEVFVKQNAQVRVATVNHMGRSAIDVIYRRAVVERDGKLEWIIGDFSSGRMISNTESDLKGEGSTAHIKSVAMGAGVMKANMTSTVNHLAPHTNSDIQARAVMKDESSSILNSITKIEKGASKSDGQQSGKVLMLNPKARGDANPILLIDENDVVAGHAASVGQIDPLQIFYLMSRGISQAEAEKLIVFGFLGAVVAEIPSKPLRERLEQVIERKFHL